MVSCDALDQLLNPHLKAPKVSEFTAATLPQVFAAARGRRQPINGPTLDMRLSNEPLNRQTYQPRPHVRGGDGTARDFAHGEAFRPSHHPRIRWTVRQTDRSSGDGLFRPG